jgi:hypothetical protein
MAAAAMEPEAPLKTRAPIDTRGAGERRQQRSGHRQEDRAKASEMIEFLDMARARAVGAAPYIHPRLASVAIKPDSRPRPETQQALKIVIDALDDMARRKLIELMPDRSSSSSPLPAPAPLRPR